MNRNTYKHKKQVENLSSSKKIIILKQYIVRVMIILNRKKYFTRRLKN